MDATKDYRVHLYERALPPPLFRRLLRGVKALGTERLRTTYQTTFWYDLSSPTCLPEAAALELCNFIPAGKRVAGVEWWLSRMSTTDVRVDFHVDRDERLALRTGRLVLPRWSSVFFLNRCRGGLLAVTDAPPNPDNDALAPDSQDWDLVRPAPNRFAVFDGRLTHGVLDARNQVPTRKLPGQVPLRLALILNWWHRRPEQTPRWSETRLYRPLALPAMAARPAPVRRGNRARPPA
jgi:hypothetical protein